MNLDSLRLSGEQLTIVGLVLVLVGSAVVVPGMVGNDQPATNGTEVKTGTISTPEPVETERQVRSGSADTSYRSLPASHMSTDASVDAPTDVAASAGAQTMDVRTTMREGEPALVLEDDRVHEGRWVSVPASWFQTNMGGVPDAAYVEHSSGDSYAAKTEVRGGDVAFYVREFSTNTVTFSGSVTLSGNPATDGTSYSYDINDLDSTGNFAIDVTGSNHREWDNVSASGVSAGGSFDPSLAGNLEPTGPATGEPRLTVTGHTTSVSHSPFNSRDFEATMFGDAGDLDSDGNDEKYNSEFSIIAPTSGTLETVTVNKDASVSNINYEVKVDVYVIQEGVDGTHGEGTKIKDNWRPESNGYTLNTDTAFDVTEGNEYTIGFVTQNLAADDGVSSYVEVGEDRSPTTARYALNGATDSISPKVDVTIKEQPDVSVTDTNSGTTQTIGPLSEGQTETVSMDLSTASTIDFSNSGGGGNIDYKLAAREGTQTVEPTVTVNGNPTSYTGSIADGTTQSLTTDTAWLQSGTNTVDVTVGDGTLSADAPTPQVGLSYSHDATDKVKTTSTETKWLEQYNVSKQYASDRSSATLTIPHKRSVLRINNVETRTNGGTWNTVPESDYNLSGTELTVQLGSVSAGDEVEVRTGGSVASTNNGAITVLEPTTSGEQLDSKIRIDSWGTDAYISVPKLGTHYRLHYAHSASWAENGDVRITTSEQRLRLPGASAGDETFVSTIPVEATPQTGDVTVSVSEPSSSEPKFSVGQGQTPGDDVDFTHINASDGEEYVLYSQSSDVARDSGTANSPLTLTDDDSGETLQFLLETGSSGGGSSGGSAGIGVVAPAGGGDGNFLPLIGIAGAIAGLLVIAGRDEQVTQAGESAAGSIEQTAGRVPVLGPALGGVLGGLTRGGAQLVRTVLGNQTVSAAIAIAIGLGAIQAQIIFLPEGSLVILVVAAVAGLSFLGLREYDEFTLARWAGVVVAATVVALQVTSDADLLTAIVNSQVFPIVAIGGLYLAYRAIQSIRQPSETTTVVVQGGNGEQ